MTDFDKKLIEKAKAICPHYYRDINVLIDIADSDECRRQLEIIKQAHYEVVLETN